MIYLDASIALAHLFGEARRPPDSLWYQEIVASRLIQYEIWIKLHARRLPDGARERTTALLSGLALIELSAPVLDRALEPFPVPLRTLDALHLATMCHLRERGREVTLASYDHRLNTAAAALDFATATL